MKIVYAKFTIRHNLMVKIELFANKIYARIKKIRIQAISRGIL